MSLLIILVLWEWYGRRTNPILFTYPTAIGHAALAVGNSTSVLDADDTWLKVYLYSRAQSVMGGTSQIQRNLIARRILGLPA